MHGMLYDRSDSIIFIRGLVIHARHGLLPHEAQFGQRFVIDLDLHADHAEAVRSDNINDTIDYSEVVSIVTRSFVTSRHSLLEPTSAAIAEELLQAYESLVAVTVTVHKPHAPIAAIFDDVGVRTTLRRRHLQEAI